MPPKKGGAAPSKKTENKKKEKVIEDKTFGLKNKKGTKQQKFIAQVQKQVQSGGNPDNRKREQQLQDERKRKEEARKREEEEKKLFKPVLKQQTVEAGVDPKSIFCAFFKQGLCKKGDKCKFSHDPAVERRSAKRNLYEDDREKEEGMESWDEDKLAEVVKKKHGAEKTNPTDIICKYFLDAVENNKYGWFWACPNGGQFCKYRHALPPGFVLKKDRKKTEKTDEISLEELIEQKRAELSRRDDLTKVTLETFVLWKKRKIKEREDKEKKEANKKKDKFMSGMKVGLSGREMFTFDPKMMNQEDDEDDGEAFDLSKMERDEEGEDADDGVKVHEIKFDEFGIMEDGLDLTTSEQLGKGGAAAAASAAVIDEDLFDDEDLDELEEDMIKLDV